MFEKLKQRRLWPDAGTSDQDFLAYFASLEESNSIFQDTAPEPVDTSDTILYKVKHYTQKVQQQLGPNCPDYLVRLSVGVLAFGRSRQADIFLREHALIYWIAEGGRTLRFHAGDCFMKTPSGAFQQHRGIPPDHDRVQAFLMHIEGIFRLMPNSTDRSPEGFLEAIKNLWAAHNEGLEAFLRACVDACLSFEGDPPTRRGRQQDQDGAEGREDAEPAPTKGNWKSSMAKTIMAVKKQLSLELTQDKLLHFMSGNGATLQRFPLPECATKTVPSLTKTPCCQQFKSREKTFRTVICTSLIVSKALFPQMLLRECRNFTPRPFGAI